MIVKLFGIMDLFCVIILLLLHYSIGMHWKFILIGALYLVGKGISFAGNFHSHLDIGIGIYIALIFLIGFSHWFTFIPAAYLGHKGVKSLV